MFKKKIKQKDVSSIITTEFKGAGKTKQDSVYNAKNDMINKIGVAINLVDSVSEANVIAIKNRNAIVVTITQTTIEKEEKLNEENNFITTIKCRWRDDIEPPTFLNFKQLK